MVKTDIAAHSGTEVARPTGGDNDNPYYSPGNRVRGWSERDRKRYGIRDTARLKIPLVGVQKIPAITDTLKGFATEISWAASNPALSEHAAIIQISMKLSNASDTMKVIAGSKTPASYLEVPQKSKAGYMIAHPIITALAEEIEALKNANLTAEDLKIVMKMKVKGVSEQLKQLILLAQI